MRKTLFKMSVYSAQIVANSIVGFIFIRKLAQLYGASNQLAAFQISYSIPFVIMAIVGMTYLHTVIASALSKLRVEGSGEFSSFLSTTVNLSILGALLPCGMVIGFHAELSTVLAPGLPPESLNELSNMLILFMPLTMILGISCVLSSAFTAYQIPLTDTLALLVSRLLPLVLLYVLPLTLVQCVYGMLFGSTVVVFLQYKIAVRKMNFKYFFHIRITHRIKQTLQQGAVFIIVAILAYTVNLYRNRLATFVSGETVVILTMAMTMTNGIRQLFGKTIVFAVNSRYVKLLNTREPEKAQQMVIWYSLLVAIFAILLVLFLRANIVTLTAFLFSGGHIDNEIILKVAPATNILLLGLVPDIILFCVLTPITCKQNNYTSFFVYGIGYIIELIIYRIGFVQFGINALLYGSVIRMCFNAVIGYFVFFSFPDKKIN